VVARDDGLARECFQKLRDMFERVFEILDVDRPEFVPFEFEGGEEVPFKIENDAQAGVWLATHEGEKVDLLHNEIGPYEGSTLVTDSGVGLIIVETDRPTGRLLSNRRGRRDATSSQRGFLSRRI